MLTSLQELDLSKQYTYADYILWQFKERVELLKGRIFPMAAPNVQHQRISSYLHTVIGGHLLNRNCDLFSAPFDVRLPLPKTKATPTKMDTVVQPDLCVICDGSKLDKQGCVGAPDLIIEILSPGNSKREMKDKYALYEEAGVLEYWVVSPPHKLVFAYVLDEVTNRFVGQAPLTEDDELHSKVIEGLVVNLTSIFPKTENG